MIRFISKAMLIAALSFSGGAYAADMHTTNYCDAVGNSGLLTIDSNAQLTSEVVRLMDEAVSVADSTAWINSRKPAFVWASEAKAACGKAYGYLQSNYRDDEYITKCDCFHARMVHYMN